MKLILRFLKVNYANIELIDTVQTVSERTEKLISEADNLRNYKKTPVTHEEKKRRSYEELKDITV